MARIRTIKPNFFKNEDLCRLDAETHILAAGLLCYADDEGYFNANPKLVQAEIFPLRELSRNITGMLHDLSSSGYIRLGICQNGREYGHIVNFLQHQVVSHAKPSEIKALEISWNVTGTFTEPSILNRTELNRTELNGIEEERQPQPTNSKRASQIPKDFQPKPSHSELAAELGLNLDTSFAAFIDYHTSKGSTFKDWDAALRTWLRNDKKFTKAIPKKSNVLEELYAE